MIRRICLLLVVLFWTTCTAMESITHKTSRICTDESLTPKCEVKFHGEKLFCRGEIVETHHFKDKLKTTSLNICHWFYTFFPSEQMVFDFPHLVRLIVRGGGITEIGDFPEFSSLEFITFNDLPLDNVRPSTFNKLLGLKQLDLSRNQIQFVEPSLFEKLPQDSAVYFGGNPWDCSRDLSGFLKHKKMLADASRITCGNPYARKPLIPVASLIEAMSAECPRQMCSCTMPNIVWDTESKFLHPVIDVNCSYRSLKEMPNRLPGNTMTLHLEGNSISDLSPLVKNKLYLHVRDVYLDNNSISNLNVLEGADWLSKFRVFSVRGNFLKQVPTYALDYGFEKNQNLVKVYLGGNPWTCSCDFTPGFQHLLIKYEAVVRDIHDIKCVANDDEHSLMQIMEISKASICYEPESSINPLDILSCILAFLIVLVLGKLAYDYWTFKRTGKLPWIVAKMP